MDNPNFYNNFPSNNYTFQNNAPQTSNYVPQPATSGQGYFPSTPTFGHQPPNYVPPPPMPPTFVPPPPPPPVFFLPSIAPIPVPDDLSDNSSPNPTKYSAYYSTEHQAQYSSKLRRYSKKSAKFEMYTPNPTDQPQPTDYHQEYTSQYTTKYSTEQPTHTETHPKTILNIPSVTSIESGLMSDDDIIINIEARLPIQEVKPKPETISIVEVKEKLCHLVLILNVIKNKEKMLTEQVSTLSEEEWTTSMEQIEKSKAQITETLSGINDLYLDSVRKRLAKRAAKRLRLKRVRLERKREKEERIREWKEKSRKIDENLQKIQDDIRKAKMEEEAKLRADEVLKEVLKKKIDAKKSIAKLEALVRLRQARRNTAKGRGESVSASEENTFNNNIEKLKSLWVKKLCVYDKEENDLRSKLKREAEKQVKLPQGKEQLALDHLAKWREVLFGGASAAPQVNFQGDVETFIASRSAWDHFLCSEGSPLPIGWVMPFESMVNRN